jgi:hypothetical protein
VASQFRWALQKPDGLKHIVPLLPDGCNFPSDEELRKLSLDLRTALTNLALQILPLPVESAHAYHHQ